jgi:hypothetical protein
MPGDAVVVRCCIETQKKGRSQQPTSRIKTRTDPFLAATLKNHDFVIFVTPFFVGACYFKNQMSNFTQEGAEA